MKQVAIIGAGPAGIFTAYALSKNKDINITMFDSGKNIYKRNCPMRDNPKQECVHCTTCGIMHGFGGAGTFSDCKLSLTPFGVGGNLIDYTDKASELVLDVEHIYSFFDEDRRKRTIIGTTDNKNIENIITLGEKDGIKYTSCPTKHLGTDGTLKVMIAMYEYLLSKNVHMYFNTTCLDIVKSDDNNFNFIVKTDKYGDLYFDYVVVAPGRSGNIWFSNIAKKLGVETKHNKVDIGVRLETSYDITKNLTDNLYDVKLSYTHPQTGDKVRTFCTNPKGYVSEEHYTVGAVANGHSFADKKSNNTNFAILVTLNDDKLNSDYLNRIVELSNSISNGKLIIQNCTDFMHDQPTKTMDNRSNVVPTLSSAVPGDLTEILPSRVCSMIKTFLKKLNKNLAKNIIWDDTWLYGIEAKFYSDLIGVNSKMETSIPGLYCIGDGSGITRGITQSAASGLIAAEDIISKLTS